MVVFAARKIGKIGGDGGEGRADQPARLRSCGTQRERQPLGAAQHVERDAPADLVAGQRANEIVGAGDRSPRRGRG